MIWASNKVVKGVKRDRHSHLRDVNQSMLARCIGRKARGHTPRVIERWSWACEYVITACKRRMAWQSCLRRPHEVKKPVPEWRDESWVEERKLQKNAAKTTPDDEDMFETQEWTIGGADRARKAPKTAKNDHAWHDFDDLANKCLCLRAVFIGPQVFKTKVENDSDITRTSQPTCSRPVECVGLVTY